MADRLVSLTLTLLLVLAQLGASLHQMGHLHHDGPIQASQAAHAESQPGAALSVDLPGEREAACALCLALQSLGGLPAQALHLQTALVVRTVPRAGVPVGWVSGTQAQDHNRGPPAQTV